MKYIKKSASIKVSLLLILLFSNYATAQAKKITMLTHNLAGQAECRDFICRGKVHTGKRSFYIELINALTNRLKYENKIKEVPFKRGLYYVQKQDDFAFFAVQKTAARENTVKWVGPISSGTDYFYEWRSRPTGIKTVADAKNLRVCVLNGSVHDTLLTKNKFSKLNRISNYTKCFQMLALNRVDLAISSATTIQPKLTKENISFSDIKQTPVEASSGNIYIALSKNIADKEIEKWNSALMAIKNSGQYMEIAQQYLVKQTPVSLSQVTP